jgi:hypothetical protein
MTASPMMTFYREWQNTLAQSNSHMSDDAHDAFVVEVLAPLEEKLPEVPITTTANLLARIKVELAYVLNRGSSHEELTGLIDERIGATDCRDADAQLRDLADQFKLDAMAIDPTVTGMWGYYDETINDRDSAFQGLFLERKGSPLIRRRGSKK